MTGTVQMLNKRVNSVKRKEQQQKSDIGVREKKTEARGLMEYWFSIEKKRGEI